VEGVDIKGDSVGDIDGDSDGLEELGDFVGEIEGELVGATEVGYIVGFADVGELVGEWLGDRVCWS
jgi:hypothetical protein